MSLARGLNPPVKVTGYWPTRTSISDLRLVQDTGACRGEGPDLFFIPTGVKESDFAHELCWHICKVREQCLNWALAHEDHGFWGGYSERQRRNIRRQRRLSLRPITANTASSERGRLGAEKRWALKPAESST